jgi:DedD protein
LAHATDDDGFHEIQLNGKQLVFLFMAATVVSVVIFLCGVLVGRGVRAERSTVEAASATPPPIEPAPQPATPEATPPAGSDPRTAAAPPPPAELSYAERLGEKKPTKDQLKPAEPVEKPPAAVKPVSPPPAPAASSSGASATHAVPAAPAPPTAAESGGEFTVQIAALNARGEADAIAHRLTTKGYAAYVVPPGNGAVMYRVRVGKFKTRREAEPVASKLQKEEQFKPWITR